MSWTRIAGARWEQNILHSPFFFDVAWIWRHGRWSRDVRRFLLPFLPVPEFPRILEQYKKKRKRYLYIFLHQEQEWKMQLPLKVKSSNRVSECGSRARGRGKLPTKPYIKVVEIYIFPMEKDGSSSSLSLEEIYFQEIFHSLICSRPYFEIYSWYEFTMRLIFVPISTTYSLLVVDGWLNPCSMVDVLHPAYRNGNV